MPRPVSDLKPFWVQKRPGGAVWAYADFFAAERYAIACLHELRGEETRIMHGAAEKAVLVAYCRLIINKTRRQAITYVSAAWSSAINLSIDRMEYKTKKSIRKNYKFIDSHLQINLFD